MTAVARELMAIAQLDPRSEEGYRLSAVGLLHANAPSNRFATLGSVRHTQNGILLNSRA